MSKKSYKMTDKERKIHEKAVKIRKMTDAQICNFIEQTYKKGYDDGIKKQKDGDKAKQVKKFIEYLNSRIGSGNRIGYGTIYYLNREFEKAVTKGLFDGDEEE